MIAAKPHKEYPQQLELLLSRGMLIHDRDRDRAMRKLSQVGYYRLSGFWYTSRILQANDAGLSFRSENFLPGTSFEQAYDLYLFDKKLRLLMMDALERIEIHIRSIIAHEVGRHDPLAYRKKSYINQRFLNDGKKGELSTFEKWLNKLDNKIKESRDDCITWHRNQQKEIPFWVVVESWDFGQMSKYYAMLNGGMQSKIIKRLQLDNQQTLTKWLQCLNLLRNRCAHHSRIWNRKHASVPIPQSDFFSKLKIEDNESERLYSAICIIWYLVKKIGPSSTWLRQIADHFDKKPNMPGCSYDSMGVPKSGFPRTRFGDALGFVSADNDPVHQESEDA
ncbi:Abi family protein [Enterobacter sp. PTB]|uniref:Abi family protein n=1 Tax=Enterobacter sp. PTB TaxID=3143437 RepID=UPI003DA9A44A